MILYLFQKKCYNILYGYVVVAMYLKLFAEVIRVLNGVNQYPCTDEGLPAHPIKDFYLIMYMEKIYGIIYCATNLINYKVYIGRTVNSLKSRISNHYTYARSNKPKDKLYFYKAINKYGENNFEWEIIDKAYNNDELNEKEKYWIKRYKSMNSSYGYNLREGGKGGKLSERTKKKMSDSQKKRTWKHTQAWYDNIHKYLAQRQFSSETLKKMSDSHKGIKMTSINKEKLRQRMLGKQYSLGRHQSEETRRKISVGQKGMPKPKPIDFGEKIRKSRIGFRYTDEQKKELGQAHKNKMTDEIRKHLSEGQKKRWENYYKNNPKN
jgi:group I intron endonuclease